MKLTYSHEIAEGSREKKDQRKKKTMIGMTHPAINQRGGNDRAEICSGIFLTSIYPALLNDATSVHRYTESQLGAQPRSLTNH